MLLHHGTILVNTDTQAIRRYLTPSRVKLSSKGVDSVEMRVMNISEINPDLTHTRLCAALSRGRKSESVFDGCGFISEYYTDSLTKLTSQRWIFDHNNEYSLRIGPTRLVDIGTVELRIDLENDKVRKIYFNTDSLLVDLFDDVSNAVMNSEVPIDLLPTFLKEKLSSVVHKHEQFPRLLTWLECELKYL
jgi:lipoate-protein ligase A